MKKPFLLCVLIAMLSVPLPATAAGSCGLPEDDRCELWSATWDSGSNERARGAFPEEPDDSVVHGSWLYTTGQSYDGGKASSLFLLKTDTATGKLAWAVRYNRGDTKLPFDAGRAVAVSPDGSLAYVVGTASGDWGGGSRAYLVAFSAENGKRLWKRSIHKGRASGSDVEVSATGAGVYVAGSGLYKGKMRQAVVARFNSTSRRLWKRDFGRADAREYASDLSIDEDRVYVSAVRGVSRRNYDLLTTAYSLRGERLWSFISHDEVPGYVYGAELRARGGMLYQLASSQETAQGGGITSSSTYAFGGATGTVAWSDVVVVPKTDYISIPNLAMSPDGAVIYAIGLPGAIPAGSFEEFHVRAYNSSDGQILWTTEFDPEVGDVIATDAVAREDEVVIGGTYVPGLGRDLITVSFARSDGGVLWSALFNPSDSADAEVNSRTMARSPSGAVFHAGELAYGRSEKGTGYARIDVAVAAYE